MSQSKGQRILITGSSGFIGSRLQTALTQGGYTVRGLDLAFGEDVRDRTVVGAVFDAFQPHVCVHLAEVDGVEESFSNIRKTVDTNIIGTLNFLEAAKGADTSLIIASKPPISLNPYVISKVSAESFALMHVKYYELLAVVLRLYKVYGPGQTMEPYRKAIPSFIESTLTGKPLVVYGDGNQILDWIYIDDVVEAFVRTIERLLGKRRSYVIGRSLQIGTGIGSSVNSIASRIVKLTRSKSKIIHEDMRMGEDPNSNVVANPEEATISLKLPKFTSIDEGLKATVDWYKKRFNK